MLKKFTNPTTPFAMYFKEADGDDTDSVSVTVAPRQNRGTDYNDDSNTVTVGPRNNRGTDYSQADDAEDDTADDTPPDEPADDAPPAEPDTGDDEATDYSDDGDDPDADPDATGDEGADGDEEAAPDEPDTGGEGAEDYTDDSGTDGGDDTAADDGSGEGNGPTPEEQAENNKKYHMYKRFMHLYNLLEVFIDKSRNIVKPDASQNAVIKTFANNLTDLYENMFDFMTIRYKSSSYVQILIYFETIISTVRLNFELLKNNKINLKQ